MRDLIPVLPKQINMDDDDDDDVLVVFRMICYSVMPVIRDTI